MMVPIKIGIKLSINKLKLGQIKDKKKVKQKERKQKGKKKKDNKRRIKKNFMKIGETGTLGDDTVVAVTRAFVKREQQVDQTSS